MTSDMGGKEGREAIAHLESVTAEAERAFANRPKALWSDRTYLAPKTAKALRAVLSEIDRRRDR